jgi:hypothetical protein
MKTRTLWLLVFGLALTVAFVGATALFTFVHLGMWYASIGWGE